MADFYVWSGSGVVDYTTRAWALGDRMVPAPTNTSTNHLAAKGVVWECTTAGTTTTALPTWPATITRDSTTLTVDSVVFTARRPGFSSGSTIDWTFASPYLYHLLAKPATSDGGFTANDYVFVASDHNATNASNATASQSFTGPVYVVSVSRTTSTRPTAQTIGATETITSTLFVGGSFVYFGIRFALGGANLNLVSNQTGTSHAIYKSCVFDLSTTSAAAAQLSFGNGSVSGGQTDLYDCWVKYGSAVNTSTGVLNNQNTVNWYGGGIDPSGARPLQWMNTLALGIGKNTFDGVDLSHLADAGVLVRTLSAAHGPVVFRNCRLPASWTGAISASMTSPQARIECIYTGNASSSMGYRSQQRGGTIVATESVFRAGYPAGAGTAHSLLVATTSLADILRTVSTPELAPQPLTAGTPVTVSVDLLDDGVTLTNADAWLEGIVMTTSGSPLGTPLTTQPGWLDTPTNIPASTETWTSPGVTTPVRQKLSLTFTPQVSGWAYFRVHVARPSTTVYIDPVVRVA